MNKLLLIGFLVTAIVACEKGNDNFTDQYIAKIVGFDLNCSTCILFFPNDSIQVLNKLGESKNCFYRTVNLSKDEFKIGQILKVRVRKAEKIELMTCKALYPSANYQHIYVTNYEFNSDFEYNDTIDFQYGKCINGFNNQFSICFDSVLTDSRCPEDLICIWAGEAIARFRITIQNSEPVFLDLHSGTIDKEINGYRISFLDLLPYPNSKMQRDVKNYKARIRLKQVR